MTIRVGINGFGRIGRNYWRAVNAAAIGMAGRVPTGEIEIVAANDLGDIATMAHLLKYDTVLGVLPVDVSVSGDTIRVGDSTIKFLAERTRRSCPGATSAWTSCSSPRAISTAATPHAGTSRPGRRR